MISILKICQKFLDIAGLGKNHDLKLSQIILFTLSVTNGIIVSCFVGMHLVVSEKYAMAEVTDACSCFLLIFHGICTWGTTMSASKSSILKLTDAMENEFWGPDDILDTAALDKYAESKKRLKSQTHFLLIVYVLALIGHCLVPLIGGDQGVALTFQSYKPDWLPLTILVIMQEYALVMTVFLPITSTDMMFFTIVEETRIQFMLLGCEIKRCLSPITETAEDNLKIDGYVKKCVDKHNFLLKFTKDINSAFKMYMFFYIGDFLLAMCIEMYILSTEDNFSICFKSAVYVSSGFSELMICYCFPAQSLLQEANNISEMAYSSRWYELGEHNKYLIMIIAKGQILPEITAGGFLLLNLKTGMAILKSTVSYYTSLKTIGVTKN